MHDVLKKMLSDENLGGIITISGKKLWESMQFSILTRKMTGNGMKQNPVNLQCKF